MLRPGAARRLTASAAGATEKFPAASSGAPRSRLSGEAGKGRHTDPASDWYAWTHDAGNIADGTVSGDLPENGPGHWARFRSDLKLAAKRLHNNAFRFSVEWSRIFPRSTEGIDVGARIGERDLERLDRRANHRAVCHYRKVLKAAARRGVTPFVTLHHWTIPTWLHDPIATRAALVARGPNEPLPELGAGGWLEGETVDEFEKYAAYMAWKLGGRADYWNTLNEPLVQVTFGYVNVPGADRRLLAAGSVQLHRRDRRAGQPRAGEHRRLRRAEALRRGDADGDGHDSRVGPVMNMVAFTPAIPSSPADREATEHADYLFNRLFLNAVVRGDVDANGDGATRRPRRTCTGERPTSSA